MIKTMPRFLRNWVRRLRDLPIRFQEWPQQRHLLGGKAARQLGWSTFVWPIGDSRDPAGPASSITLPGLQHPFWFRHGTSDVLVIKQLFIKREYQRLQELKDIKVILDIGANIGAASVMFLSIFPQARIIAVEPEPSNVAILQRNLAPYGERAVVIPAAVWPTPDDLAIVRHHFRDGLDWSNQVQAADGNSSSKVAGITIQQIMDQQQITQIDLLKMDIEGAELPVLKGNTDWLRSVRHFCIELHGQECHEAFTRAMEPFQFSVISEGETMYCHHLALKSAM